jgi:hypothetical protein
MAPTALMAAPTLSVFFLPNLSPKSHVKIHPNKLPREKMLVKVPSRTEESLI